MHILSSPFQRVYRDMHILSNVFWDGNSIFLLFLRLGERDKENEKKYENVMCRIYETSRKLQGVEVLREGQGAEGCLFMYLIRISMLNIFERAIVDVFMHTFCLENDSVFFVKLAPRDFLARNKRSR